MENARVAKYKRFTGLVLASLIGMGIVVTAWTSRGAAPPATTEIVERRIRKELIANAELTAASKVPGFKILKIEKRLEENHILVSLRNDCPKTITGFRVAVGIVREGTDFLLGAGDPEAIRPGMVRQVRYPIQAELETAGVVILAVMFEDGSTDGEPDVVANMIQDRHGVKIQQDHTVRLLRRFLRATPAGGSLDPSNMESEIPALSDSEVNALEPQAQRGYRNEVERILREFHAVVKATESGGQVALRREIQGLADRYEYMSRTLVIK